MNKSLTTLVERLNRIFPHLSLYYEGEYFDNQIETKSNTEELDMDDDFAPPMKYDWYDIIKILKQNGLEIKNIK